ncbi:MAG: hypothetical protein OXT67_03530 [Zetaproteobacteria bacterium]|nr:hypothetical protein [Zetaproteobacteria bacterium]
MYTNTFYILVNLSVLLSVGAACKQRSTSPPTVNQGSAKVTGCPQDPLVASMAETASEDLGADHLSQDCESVSAVSSSSVGRVDQSRFAEEGYGSSDMVENVEEKENLNLSVQYSGTLPVVKIVVDLNSGEETLTLTSTALATFQKVFRTGDSYTLAFIPQGESGETASDLQCSAQQSSGSFAVEHVEVRVVCTPTSQGYMLTHLEWLMTKDAAVKKNPDDLLKMSFIDFTLEGPQGLVVFRTDCQHFPEAFYQKSQGQETGHCKNGVDGKQETFAHSGYHEEDIRMIFRPQKEDENLSQMSAFKVIGPKADDGHGRQGVHYLAGTQITLFAKSPEGQEVKYRVYKIAADDTGKKFVAQTMEGVSGTQKDPLKFFVTHLDDSNSVAEASQNSSSSPKAAFKWHRVAIAGSMSADFNSPNGQEKDLRDSEPQFCSLSRMRVRSINRRDELVSCRVTADKLYAAVRDDDGHLRKKNEKAWVACGATCLRYAVEDQSAGNLVADYDYETARITYSNHAKDRHMEVLEPSADALCGLQNMEVADLTKHDGSFECKVVPREGVWVLEAIRGRNDYPWGQCRASCLKWDSEVSFAHHTIRAEVAGRGKDDAYLRHPVDQSYCTLSRIAYTDINQTQGDCRLEKGVSKWGLIAEVTTPDGGDKSTRKVACEASCITWSE